MTTTALPRTASSEGATAARTSRALTVVAATAAGVAVWAIAGPVAGIDLAVHAGTSPRPVGLVSVVVAAVVAGALGAGVLALLERTTGRARRLWFPIATTTLVTSLAGPLGAVTFSAGAALAAMHVAVGVVLIVGLGRSAQNSRC